MAMRLQYDAGSQQWPLFHIEYFRHEIVARFDQEAGGVDREVRDEEQLRPRLLHARTSGLVRE